MQYSPSFCLLFQPITFHFTLLFYSHIHSVENDSLPYKWIRILGDSLVSKNTVVAWTARCSSHRKQGFVSSWHPSEEPGAHEHQNAIDSLKQSENETESWTRGLWTHARLYPAFYTFSPTNKRIHLLNFWDTLHNLRCLLHKMLCIS